MILQAVLDQAIKKVCPIHGVSFGKLDDKKTWRIDFDDAASAAQKLAAVQVLDEFVWNDEKEKEEEKKQKRQSHKKELAMKLHYALWLKENPGKKFDEFMDYAESLEA